MHFFNVQVATRCYEKEYLFDKTLFVNKVSTSFKWFSELQRFGSRFEGIICSILVEKFRKFSTDIRNFERRNRNFYKQTVLCLTRAYGYLYKLYAFHSALTFIRGLSVAVFHSFRTLLILDQNKCLALNQRLNYYFNVEYVSPIFYGQNFLYRKDLIFNTLSTNFLVFIRNLHQQKMYTAFFSKFFFVFNKKLQRLVTNSVPIFDSHSHFSAFLFSKTLATTSLEFQLDLILKNYKYLRFNLEKFAYDINIKKTLIAALFKKIAKVFLKYGPRKNFTFFLTKIKYILFLRKQYYLFFKPNMNRGLRPSFFKKLNGFFKPLLKQYYKRYGRRYKRRPNGRIRMWHLFFLRNRKRKKNKKLATLGHKKRFNSWLIKTKRFIHLRTQIFHKQVIKYVYLNDIKITQFKGYFKINQLASHLIWNTFRLRIVRYGPNNTVKNIVRYNKYNLSNNLYLRRKLIKGRLANFFWRRSVYLKKNFFLNIDRMYKRLINFALDCLAPVGFMGAFRVKRQKKVLKRSFITKNYRRYFLGAKLLVSLSKKNKRMADIEKVAFRVWHLWRFINCGKKPKYFRDTLQKYYKPFAGVKSNQRLWKWRYVSDRGTIFKYFYW